MGLTGSTGTSPTECLPTGSTVGRKVLVIGATGLLGRPLMRHLASQGFNVASVSSKPPEKLHAEVRLLIQECGVCHMPLDLDQDITQNGGGLEAILQKGSYSLLINLAADRGGIKYDGQRCRMTSQVLNVDLPIHLAELSARLSIPVFHISTEYVWSGDGNTDTGYPAVPLGTDDRMLQEGAGAPYAREKRLAELGVEVSGARVTIIRIPVLYGRMLNGMEEELQGINNFLQDNSWLHDTWQLRYPTNADDCARILTALASKLLDKGLDHSVYHYGAQSSISKYDFIHLFAKSVGLQSQHIKTESADSRPAEKRPPYNVKLDISKTREELGDLWHEPTTLDEDVVKKIWLPHFRSTVEMRCGIEDAIQKFHSALSESPTAASSALRLCIVGVAEIPKSQLLKLLADGLCALSNLVIITCGLQGVQENFVKHCAGRLRVWNIIPEGRTSTFGVGICAGTDDAEARRVFCQVGDVYLAVDGGEGRHCTLSLTAGDSVIPLRRGVSLFGNRRDSKKPDFMTDEQWALLKEEVPEDQTVSVVVDSIGKAIDAKVRERACVRVEDYENSLVDI
eukprot:CAMPEP_0170615232 /NCGR_PEP_ID=MMETSP0224-20130122/25227_1 /TAXON_ID=285029 /ORGANISM="Togula jolla, Strain CCCM 725" /LENGTH=567 /DNA_ID=CAMNT_0010940949 /DNA_START=18 /DNA_END=1722 /DNA_ORIENTATION=-